MIKVKTPPPGIRLTDKAQPLVDPTIVAKALGADVVYQTPSPAGAPHAIFALREDLFRRLISKGGRPSLDGVAKRPKVPVTDEDWDTLKRIAKHLSQSKRSVTPAQIASAIIHTSLEKLTRTPLSPPQKVGGVEGLEEHIVRAQSKVLEHSEMLDVEGIVEWSRRFPRLEKMWIIVPDFLDDTNPDVLDEVVYNIKERGVQFTYFVHAEDIREGGRFSKLRVRIGKLIGDETTAPSHVLGVPLSEEQLMWLQTDHVIANPHRKAEAIGFQYVRHDIRSAFAIRMGNYQLGTMIEKLTMWANIHSTEFKERYNMLRPVSKK